MTDYVGGYAVAGAMYHQEAHRLADKLRTDATITDGVIRWNSNQQVPPSDCVALAAHIGLPVDVVAACTAARDIETETFLADYRKRPQQPSVEEIAGMRAAFGPGQRVVNIVTGRVTRT